LIDPKDQQSKEKGYWAGTIGGLREQGWKVLCANGSGRKGGAAAAAVGDGRHEDEEYTRWLGTCATVGDAERAAIGLPCTSQGSMKFILSDSQAAIASILNMSRGQPPRSGLESEIKSALEDRKDEDKEEADANNGDTIEACFDHIYRTLS